VSTPARVAPLRIIASNRAPVQPMRSCVLYWMTAARRVRFNHALQRALEWCADLGRPLLIFEPLRVDYPWASERIHRFVLDGMHDNAQALGRRRSVSYLPYVEPAPGEGRGLLAALAADSCVVVTDAFPDSFLPRMLASAAARVDVLVESVDSNGLLPLRAAAKAHVTAASFRRHMQAALDLSDAPLEDPFTRYRRLPPRPALGDAIVERWPPADRALLTPGAKCGSLPVDRGVPMVDRRGGAKAARALLESFVAARLSRYAADRNEPMRDASSMLSPYLHFGHISAWEVFAAIAAAERWHPGRLAVKPTGARHGWWGMSPSAEAYLDQLVTWRELAYNTSAHLTGHDRFDSLPEWARRTLEAHEGDPRPELYTVAQLEAALTNDPLWNAAQRQLITEGRIHNYVRMLWGKRVLTWTCTARGAFEALLELNDRWALDGRDPNSCAGVAWCFGRYDHPWPERPIFGSVRAMTSASTGRKFDARAYTATWSGEGTKQRSGG
jgi:deoxyribodipyrimidine photo-lyase